MCNAWMAIWSFWERQKWKWQINDYWVDQGQCEDTQWGKKEKERKERVYVNGGWLLLLLLLSLEHGLEVNAMQPEYIFGLRQCQEQPKYKLRLTLEGLICEIKIITLLNTGNL